MKPRIMLRADAGSSIGFGHFIRTSALAAYLREDFDCVIASYNPDGPLTPFQLASIAESGATALDLNSEDMVRADKIFLESLGKEDLVVLDNYYFTTDYQRAVRNKTAALVCIDDVHDRHFVADVVMTFCPLSASDFSMEPYTRFYGGTEWAFLRAPFLEPVSTRNRAFPGQRMVMAMGGADPLGLSDKMIRVVRDCFPDIEINVIAGQTVKISVQPDRRLHILNRLDASRIASLFDECDWGLFPASTICVEAFSRGLPVIAGHYVDNQEEFYAHGVREGWFAPLGLLTDTVETLCERLTYIINNSDSLEVPNFDFRARKQDIINIFKSLVS